MFRYKITVEYDGSCFCGWQQQGTDTEALAPAFPSLFWEDYLKNPFARPKRSSLPSVQSVLERAVQKMTGHAVLVEGAGRTDAGVHATGQVAHFDLPTRLEPQELLSGMNFYSRAWGVSVLQVAPASENFHARFSATSRTYLYKIVNRAAPLILDRNRAWHIASPLCVSAMQEASAFFLGSHNFQTFRSAHCQSQKPQKTLDLCDVFQMEDVIGIRVKARSFLHNQVRIMAGTLVLIGKGKCPPATIANLLQKEDRTQAGPTAPAHGLYLEHVAYNRLLA
ncbi:tRNA pseudouridine synthase A [Alphaproteobacteria bacterium]|nr:tRNA pseudouridine synthase A [Alphaproteobacteria bacterium]GHS97221.1 tRNA pseudouridine synthase A [Alphaproteobacteria bacterium]